MVVRVHKLTPRPLFPPPHPSFPMPRLSFPMPRLSFPMPPFLSFPTFLIGNPEFSPGRGTRMEGQKRKTWIPAKSLRE